MEKFMKEIGFKENQSKEDNPLFKTLGHHDKVTTTIIIKIKIIKIK